MTRCLPTDFSLLQRDAEHFKRPVADKVSVFLFSARTSSVLLRDMLHSYPPNKSRISVDGANQPGYKTPLTSNNWVLGNLRNEIPTIP